MTRKLLESAFFSLSEAAKRSELPEWFRFRMQRDADAIKRTLGIEVACCLDRKQPPCLAYPDKCPDTTKRRGREDDALRNALLDAEYNLGAAHPKG